MDPSKDKKPRSMDKMNSRRPEELIEEARKNLKNRTTITNSACD